MKAARHIIVFLALAGVEVLSGCTGGQAMQSYIPATGGDPRQGLALIRAYKCGACHTIPGVPDANGLVGPPLNFYSRRTFIAGELPNTPENLVHWIQSPPSVEPATAMPQLGLSLDEARSVAAYLYTLH